MEELPLEKQLLDKLRAEKQEIERLISALEKRLGIESEEAEEYEEEEFVAVIRANEFQGLSRSQAAIQLLKKTDRPLTTPQIFQFLKSGGVEMSNKNSLSALYTSLKRTPEIHRVRPNTWALKEWRRYKG